MLRVSLLRTALWALAAMGLVVPWIFNLQFFATGGSLRPGVFWPAAFANPLTTAITLDVYLAALAFALWVAADRALGRWRWALIAACFGLGLSFALPLYLARRAVPPGAV